MAQFFSLHETHPEPRLIRQAVTLLREGAVVALPTDSAYALCCHLEDSKALHRLRTIRRTDRHHHFTLLCANLSEIATFAKADNAQYRLLKQLTPGPYTFILPGSKELPRRVLHEKRRTVGLRCPDHVLVQALLQELGEPLLSCTLLLDGESNPLTDPQEIRKKLEHQVDLVMACGTCKNGMTTVLDLTGSAPTLTRLGLGAVDKLGLSQ